MFCPLVCNYLESHKSSEIHMIIWIMKFMFLLKNESIKQWKPHNLWTHWVTHFYEIFLESNCMHSNLDIKMCECTYLKKTKEQNSDYSTDLIYFMYLLFFNCIYIMCDGRYISCPTLQKVCGTFFVCLYRIIDETGVG